MCMLVLVVFMFSISYVTNLALWLQEFNKLTYLLTDIFHLLKYRYDGWYAHCKAYCEFLFDSCGHFAAVLLHCWRELSEITFHNIIHRWWLSSHSNTHNTNLLVSNVSSPTISCTLYHMLSAALLIASIYTGTNSIGDTFWVSTHISAILFICSIDIGIGDSFSLIF